MPATFEPVREPSGPALTISRDVSDPIVALRNAPRGAERFRDLEQLDEDALSVVPSFERVRTAKTEELAARNRLEALIKPRSEGGHGMDATSPTALAQHEVLARLADDAARLQTQYEVRGQARQTISRLRATCSAWLISLPS